MKRWSHAEPEHFNIIFAQPKPSLDHDHDHDDHDHDHVHDQYQQPLVVLLHDGPHKTFCRSFNLVSNTLLKMGASVLMINYRGSTGMGDSSLESIIGHIGEVPNHFIYFLTENQ